MRLHEHEDFAAFVTAAARESELSEPFVEKDYWITEILRTVAETLGDRAIFKGGTSLSKGWDLLDRFSEDIDLFINPAVEPALANPRAIDRTLKQLKGDVAAIPGLDFVPDDSQTIGGLGRRDIFRYASHYPTLQGFPPTVRLEPGIQSGDQPTATVPISSIVGRTLVERGVADELGAAGLQPFPMTLLHFRRTFAKSRTYFPASYRPPDGLRFDQSDALFPDDHLRATIEPAYEDECRRLFFRPHPPFSDVLGRLATIRDKV